MIVTAHQLNFLPGRSVMERIRQADVVIWLDGTQYARHSFVNRNRFGVDEPWLTVPVNEHDTFAPINRVRIADLSGQARRKIARTLEHRLGAAAAPYVAELGKPYKLLAGLNHALMQHLLRDLGIEVEQTFQSFLDGEHSLPVVSDEEADLVPVRERFADMAAQLGATVWLTGPGRRHGDESRFADQGIEIRQFEWPKDAANPCALDGFRQLQEVAA